MLSSPDLSFCRILPIVVFNQLGELLEQMAQTVGSAALVLTEAVLVRICIPGEWQRQRFTLVVSEQFSTLLVGNFDEEQGSYSGINAQLTFNLDAIASFVYELRDLFECDSYTHQNLERYRQIIRPNDATLQSKFSLLLLEYLLTQPTQEIIAPPSSTAPAVYICQPVEDALKKQIFQERLLNQVTTQIRKSLDLRVIMATAITQVREFLELDRLVIYKFEGSKVKTQQYQSDTILFNGTALTTGMELSVGEPSKIYFSIHDGNGKHSPFVSINNQPLLEDYQHYGGYIVYEARATDAITSVLNYTEKNCFIRTSHSEFSLVNVAENTVESLRKKATSEQINLKLDLQIDPRRDRFTADAERVAQILWNLLTNAIKFTPESGSVTLRLWVEDDTAIFQVEDTGIGIPEEQLPLLFEKFQQLDTPYRRRYEGTGIGLALTKQLVELHRGRIQVESTISIGSIFTVWIPTQAVRVLS
ncbi:sensor histidine kinase [Nostoc sp.]|uniref:sensor histidine kinase n=1 Tax=Nostoc sp. TaxID=1180 RepID=UPI002FF5012D